MSYIGRDTDKISNVEVLDNITFDGSSSYTLQKNSVNFTPSSANTLLVSIDGVVQAGNFTVSGSTIDFGTAVAGTSTCDFILHYGVGLITTPSDGTVTTAKVADGAITSAKLASGVGGVAGITSSADATAITIDSSEQVGIGTSNPTSLLELFKAGTTQIKNAYSSTKYSLFGRTGGNYYWSAYEGGAALIFSTSASDNATTERMRIDSSGNVLISKTVNDLGTAGLVLGDLGHVQSTISNSNVIYANRLSTDGDVYRIYQDGSQEGSISVSGSTVSYNGFTGTHWSRFTDNSKPTILRGTVLETLDEMCDWYNLEFDVVTQDENGNDITSSQKIPHVLVDGQSVGDTVTYNHNGTDYQATIVKEADIKHMKSKVSETVDAKNVYGVFVAYDEDGEGYNDFWVASVGSFVVRIKANETIAKGDLLQSNGDGTAKVQTDDAVRSSSFAKVLSTTVIETYDDGSFIVPCSLMC
ncbi:hypothetical protein [uncultured Mediterranean phage uvMED]|nr:hypothetical protein [uncultured Mediterranean phage uvMED]